MELELREDKRMDWLEEATEQFAFTSLLSHALVRDLASFWLLYWLVPVLDAMGGEINDRR
jgi:hypothetical protein